MKKRIIMTMACVALAAVTLTGCGAKGGKTANKKSEISVVSREDGSGTRGAFIELFGIEVKEGDQKVDKTYDKAEVTNSTSVMLTTVQGNDNAIGYVSLGSLNDSVKAVKIDGAEAKAENVDNDTYKVSRPFNIATKGKVSDVAQDFINFILSKDGQAVVEDEGYIKVSDKEFKSNGAEGKITVAGSSSVTPVMEALKEAYLKINSKASIEVQQNDSTTGMNSTIEGICDIGMASRELKDEEKSAGLTATVIAKDGIAVIVNKNNKIDELSSEQVRKIFTGETTSWEDVK